MASLIWIKTPYRLPSLVIRDCRERSSLVIISEQLGVSPPGGHGAQRPLRFAVRQMILELQVKSHSRGPSPLSFMKDAADMCSQRHKLKQMLRKDSFPLLGLAAGEDLSGGRELQSSVLEFGKLQDVQTPSAMGNR